MKKPYICLLVVCLLLCSVSSVAFAAENGAFAPIMIDQRDIAMSPASTCHEHEFAYHEGQQPYGQYCESNGGLTHSWYKSYEAECIHCASTGDVSVIGAPEDHNFIYTGFNQHLDDQCRHVFLFVCSVCGETGADTFVCPGSGDGDCVVMMFHEKFSGLTEEE